MLNRVFVNIEDKKVLTAEKILGNADALITKIEEGDQLSIETDQKYRQGSKPFSVELLRTKYFLMKGALAVALSKDLDAQDSFLDCINHGIDCDPRIRKDCIVRLINIMKKQGRPD